MVMTRERASALLLSRSHLRLLVSSLALLWLCASVVLFDHTDAACANACSGHGKCGAASQCTCDADWSIAPDCPLRKCAAGPAWADKASAPNVAHANAECLNRGLCDYSKGECVCFTGFTGAACQRMKCPGDCSGHGLCHSLTTLELQYGPDTLPGVGGNGVGPVYANWERDNIHACLCDTGYAGPDCSMKMCPKNDDPLTTGQNYRTIKITIGGTTSVLVGSVRVAFNGEVATLDASAAVNTPASCAAAFMKLRTVARATCTINVLDNTVQSAEYVVAFTEWTHIDAENNLLQHNGNPPLKAFTCDISHITSANTPTCAITDVVATNVIEHVYCSNRGVCDFTTGVCTCYADFKAVDCNQPSNVPDSIDDNDGFLVYPQGNTYRGIVLHLQTVKPSAPDFSFVRIEAASVPIFTMDGEGYTKLLKGNMEIATGSLKVQTGVTVVTNGLNVMAGGSTITSIDTADTTTEIVSTSSIFTGTALKVRTSRAASNLFRIFEAWTSTTTLVVDILGNGLTTIRTGGLSIVTGGATISDNQPATPVVSIQSNSGSFTNSVFKLDTIRPTLYPNADFLLIDANANGVPAFSVQASGRTTVFDGGMLVQNKDPAAESLVVKPADTAFAHDALSIQTTSSAAHVMLKATTGGTLLFKVDSTGLTTIKSGGLSVTAGGATITTLSASASSLNVVAANTAGPYTGKNVFVQANRAAGGDFYMLYAEVNSADANPSNRVAVFTVDGNGKTMVKDALSVGAGATITGTLAVTGATTLSDTLDVAKATMLSDTLAVGKATTLSDTLAVTGDTTITGATVLKSTLSVNGGTTISGDTTINGALAATADATVTGTLAVVTLGTRTAALNVGGAATITGTLAVTGATTLTGAVTTGAAATVAGALTVNGALAATADATVTGTLAVVTLGTRTAALNVGGAATITGTLAVTGATTLSDTLAIGGDATISGATTLLTTLTVNGGTMLSDTLTVTKAATLSDTLTVTKAVTINSNTATDATTTGALVVTGGVGVGGSVRIGGTSYAVAHSNTSDRRLKTSIAELASSADIIRRLRPVSYEWRRDEFPSRELPSGVFPGFLTDEVAQLLPSIVGKDGSGFQSVDYAALIPHVVQVVQELQREIAALQSRVQELQRGQVAM